MLPRASWHNEKKNEESEQNVQTLSSTLTVPLRADRQLLCITRLDQIRFLGHRCFLFHFVPFLLS